MPVFSFSKKVNIPWRSAAAPRRRESGRRPTRPRALRIIACIEDPAVIDKNRLSTMPSA